MIRVRVLSDFYDSKNDNRLVSAGTEIEVTEDRYKELDKYRLVEKLNADKTTKGA